MNHADRYHDWLPGSLAPTPEPETEAGDYTDYGPGITPEDANALDLAAMAEMYFINDDAPVVVAQPPAVAVAAPSPSTTDTEVSEVEDDEDDSTEDEDEDEDDAEEEGDDEMHDEDGYAEDEDAFSEYIYSEADETDDD